MNEPFTARDALVAEALGDIGVLLDRAEIVALEMRSAAEAVDRACDRLEAHAAAAEPRMAQLAEHAQGVAAKHIARSARETMHTAADDECRSMAAFARALFHSELNPALHSLLQAAKACAENRDHSRISWWACTVSAAASVMLTGLLALCMLHL